MTEKTVKQLFIFSYRPRYKVMEEFVEGSDLNTVKKACIEYCNRHGLIFISVRPALLDLTKGVRGRNLEQEEIEEKKPEKEPVKV